MRGPTDFELDIYLDREVDERELDDEPDPDAAYDRLRDERLGI